MSCPGTGSPGARLDLARGGGGDGLESLGGVDVRVWCTLS